MFFVLIASSFAAAPLDLNDVDDLTDVPTVFDPVTHVDFDRALDVNASLQGPSFGVVFAPNPKWTGSFIVLRESFFPEIAASVNRVK